MAGIIRQIEDLPCYDQLELENLESIGILSLNARLIIYLELSPDNQIKLKAFKYHISELEKKISNCTKVKTLNSYFQALEIIEIDAADELGINEDEDRDKLQLFLEDSNQTFGSNLLKQTEGDDYSLNVKPEDNKILLTSATMNNADLEAQRSKIVKSLKKIFNDYSSTQNFMFPLNPSFETYLGKIKRVLLSCKLLTNY